MFSVLLWKLKIQQWATFDMDPICPCFSVVKSSKFFSVRCDSLPAQVPIQVFFKSWPITYKFLTIWRFVSEVRCGSWYLQFISWLYLFHWYRVQFLKTGSWNLLLHNLLWWYMKVLVCLWGRTLRKSCVTHLYLWLLASSREMLWDQLSVFTYINWVAMTNILLICLKSWTWIISYLFIRV